MSPGVRPLTRTVVMVVVGLLLLLGGVAVGISGAVALALMMIVAVLLDGLHFGLYAARAAPPKIDRTVAPNPARVGETMTVSLQSQASRAGGAHGLVDLEETVPTPLSSTLTVHPARRDARGVAVVYDITPARRGQWHLGPCTIMRFSALRLWRAKVADQSTSQVTAWPTTVELGVQALFQDREGTVGMTGYQRPHTDNTTVRAYSPGDDLRRVHWRSSARRDELVVRAEEPTAADRAWVGLMIPQATLTERRELAISLAASWVQQMDNAGHVVDVACGGDIHHGTMADHLTLLATLSNAEAGLGLPTSTPEGAALLIVTRAATRSISPDALVRPPMGAGRHAGGIAVVLSDSGTDGDLVESLGWRVLRLPENLSLPDAGQALVRFQESLAAAGGGR